MSEDIFASNLKHIEIIDRALQGIDSDNWAPEDAELIIRNFIEDVKRKAANEIRNDLRSSYQAHGLPFSEGCKWAANLIDPDVITAAGRVRGKREQPVASAIGSTEAGGLTISPETFSDPVELYTREDEDNE